MFQVHAVSAFQDNYIWMLTRPGSDDAIAVDPGDDQPVERWLAETGKHLAAILVTHHHPDHTGGIASLTSDRKIPVYGPEGSPFGGITHPLSDGDELSLPGGRLQVKATPGHTLDHVSYLVAGEPGQLFCGDTLFLAGCGRLFEGTAAQMHAAMEWYATLPPGTEVYCTHEYSLANLRFAKAVEPENEAIDEAIRQCELLRRENRPTLPSRIGIERRVNPFMRAGEPSVVAAASARKGAPAAPGEETLAIIRSWKDNF